MKKVCYITLNSTSGKHRHTLRLARTTAHRGGIVDVQCDRLGVHFVNHIYHVHPRWDYVFGVMVRVGCVGKYSVCTGGGWVR